MPNSILYHNPRCSKSRQALEFLQQNNVQFDITLYLKQSFTKAELLNLIKALYANNAIDSTHDMLRTKEAEYKQSGLNLSSNDESIIEALIEYPKILERPIFKLDDKAAIGRPLENIASLL